MRLPRAEMFGKSQTLHREESEERFQPSPSSPDLAVQISRLKRHECIARERGAHRALNVNELTGRAVRQSCLCYEPTDNQLGTIRRIRPTNSRAVRQAVSRAVITSSRVIHSGATENSAARTASWSSIPRRSNVQTGWVSQQTLSWGHS